MIITKTAVELRSGDVFATDGAIVQAVALLQTVTGSRGGSPDEVSVWLICHGTEKFAYLPPNEICHLWAPDNEGTL